jgi:hypothetical protein
MSSIPDIPTAHLWKYDCKAPAAETRTAENSTSRGTQILAPAPAAAAAIADVSQTTPGSAVAAWDSKGPAPVAPQEAVSDVMAVNPGRVPAEVPPATMPENNAGSAGGTAPTTSVDANDTKSLQPRTPAAEPSSTSTAATSSTAVADDLVPVRTKDPKAADRIVSYCSKVTSDATNPTTVAARCRRDEMEAWTRLIDQNEFPSLDETSRRKCNEPPFPDSFVARESCAKYQLHLD